MSFHRSPIISGGLFNFSSDSGEAWQEPSLFDEFAPHERLGHRARSDQQTECLHPMVFCCKCHFPNCPCKCVECVAVQEGLCE